MQNNKTFIFLSIFVCTIFFGLVYSCVSGPTLGEVRSARKMMRADMSVVIRETREISEFDDDRKTKTLGAILSLVIAQDHWGPLRSRDYESLLEQLGWARSPTRTEGLYLCKHGASAVIIAPDGDTVRSGYITMTYPATPIAGC